MQLTLVQQGPGGVFTRRNTDAAAINYDGGIAWIDEVRSHSMQIMAQFPHTVAIFANEPGCKYDANLLEDPAPSVMKMFPDEATAERYIVGRRWGGKAIHFVVCPHCGMAGGVSNRTVGKRDYHCSRCRKEFTVKTGTLFHHSHIPLAAWMIALTMWYFTSGKVTSKHLALRCKCGTTTAHEIITRMRRLKKLPPHLPTLTALQMLVDCALSTPHKAKSNERKQAAE